jgi:molybdopterin-guanine dinucleotide biosynthesis protein A
MNQSSQDTRAPVGLILAGGQSRRFGSDKAIAQLSSGERFVDAIIQALRPHVDRCVVIGSRRAQSVYADEVEWWEEPDGQNGPRSALAQWVTALEELPPAGAFVAACDYPLLTTEVVAGLLRWAHVLADQPIAVVPQVCGFPHPLLAWYSRDALRELRDSTNGPASMMSLFRSIGVVHIVVPSAKSDPYTNVNRPSELSFAP